MAESADRLEVWIVATFDVAALSLALLVAGHRAGVLSGALAELGTVPGLLLFGYLWGLVVLAVRWVLADGGLHRRTGRIGSLVARGALGGGAVGGGLIAGVALVGGAIALFDAPSVFSPIAPVLLVATIGIVVGTVVGAAAGGLFAVGNVLLVSASERAVPIDGGDADAASHPRSFEE